MMNMKYEITCKEKSGLFYPDFALPNQAHYPIGKYGSLRLVFINEQWKGDYTTLLTQCRLNAYLHSIDSTAKEQMRLITAQLAKALGIDEKSESCRSTLMGDADEFM